MFFIWLLWSGGPTLRLAAVKGGVWRAMAAAWRVFRQQKCGRLSNACSCSTAALAPIRDGNVLLMSRRRRLFTENVQHAASAWRKRRNALLMVAFLTCAGINELLTSALAALARSWRREFGGNGESELIGYLVSAHRNETQDGLITSVWWKTLASLVACL